MKEIQQKLLATFQIEHRDHVEQIRSLLAIMDRTGAQPGAPELEEAFRRAHSLKGAARAVDLRPIEGLAHRLETLFSRVREGQCSLDRNTAGVVQQVLDASEDCIAALAENRPAETVAVALRAIERVLGMETRPAPAEPPPEPQAPVPAFQPLETVRITARNFDELFRTAGGLVTESQRQSRITEELDELVRAIALIEKEGRRVRHSAAAALSHAGAGRDRVRVTSLLDSLERHVHSVSRQARATLRLHRRSSWNMCQLGRQLQHDVWRARMVPAESLLEGYRQMVRGLARDEGKEIEFRASSAGVRADRRVLDALKDPVMHLLRNAVSHGIEPAAERTAKGKKTAGVVALRVDMQGQRLTVRIQDDGRGVDLARVAGIAVRDGILSPADAARSSAQDLTRILFRPGFSTSATVTSLSGRGMGLSVVYEAIRRLQGDIELQPAEGGGTVISLSVPLSIATHRVVVVNSGNQVFAIPILGIERLKRIRLSDIGSVEGKTVALLDGQSVPLAGIHALLGLESPSGRAGGDWLQIVILRSGSQRVALAVDAVVCEADAVIQDLGPAAGCEGRIASAVVLDDGSVAFVVNPMDLIQSALQPRLELQPLSFTKSAEPVAEPSPCTILVVDDSMTTRTLEKSILEAHGYRVRVAVDGMEALAHLRQETADLVIADIEMPRLNGFGLIEAMKQDAALRAIPVIIVSSVERREDQERGLALGADAYIVKRKFDQEELLGAIRQIL
ncbi:MAG TPA: response regulator [Bryobacteraceae bacterium]|nr:response regulator [Bryobacteraceae bacterium]